MRIDKTHEIVGKLNSQLGAIDLGSSYPVLDRDLETVVGVYSSEFGTPDGYRYDDSIEAYVPKKYKYIANNIRVCLDDSELVEDNGLDGANYRAIWRERQTESVWIETNGNPEVYEDIFEARDNL